MDFRSQNKVSTENVVSLRRERKFEEPPSVFFCMSVELSQVKFKLFDELLTNNSYQKMVSRRLRHGIARNFKLSCRIKK